MDIKSTDLSWLAGIIDGEGNISMSSKLAANNKRYLDVKVRVSNTDLRMLKKISEIYYSLNLRFHFAAVNFNRGTWKPALSINTTAQGTNFKLLSLIHPYLVSKKDIAGTVIDVLNFVRSFPKGGNTKRYNYWADPIMVKLQERFEQEKAWYFNPSTTTRKANVVLAFDDIV